MIFMLECGGKITEIQCGSKNITIWLELGGGKF
jgi:hypothetical protein